MANASGLRNKKKSQKKLQLNFIVFIDDLKKKIRSNFPAPKYRKLSNYSDAYYIISNPWTTLFRHRASSQICYETVPGRKKTTSFPGLFRLSGTKPLGGREVLQYSYLDVTSMLLIDTCLPFLFKPVFKSWLCGPVQWLTEETTNQFKSKASSYLRVKNGSIRREKTFPREVVSQLSRAEYYLGNADGNLLPSPLHQPSVAKRSKN